MPWFKVDDKLHDHRKARAAGKAAMGVWVLAGSWAADNLTDGFIPATILTRWGNARDAATLCAAGLWVPAEQDGERGWRFHEWAERQPTRAQKMAERAARAEAGRTGGLASGRSKRQSKTEALCFDAASDTSKPPSRPDPTTSNEVVVGGPRKRGTRLDTAAFVPSETSHDAVLNDHPQLDIRAEHAKFCDYWIAQPGQKGVKLDWDATWRNWMRRAGEQGRTRPKSRQQETDDLFAAAMQRAQAADAAHTTRGELTA